MSPWEPVLMVTFRIRISWCLSCAKRSMTNTRPCLLTITGNHHPYAPNVWNIYLHLSYIYHKLKPNVSKYSIHGGYGIIAGKSCIKHDAITDHHFFGVVSSLVVWATISCTLDVLYLHYQQPRWKDTEGVQHLHGNLRLTPNHWNHANLGLGARVAFGVR